MTSVIVVPKEVVTVNYINVVQMRVSNVNLGSDASINVTLYGPGGQTAIKYETILMAGEDYKKWTNDDNYVVEFVLNYYGLTQAS